jgi:predicted amidohydrolase YtcJ
VDVWLKDPWGILHLEPREHCMRRTSEYAVLLLGAIALVAVAPSMKTAAAAAPIAEQPLVLLDALLWDGTGDTTRTASIAVVDGHVRSIGDEATVRAVGGAGARVLDLNGALVLPGLRDQHVHVMDTGIPGVAAGAAEPSFSANNPAQSEALRGAILAFHTSVFLRGETPESGCERSQVTEAMKGELLAAEQIMAAQGLTTTVEAGLSDLGQLEALFELAEEGRLTMRWLPRIGAGCVEDAAALGWTTGTGNEWVRLLGVKLYADGWLGPRSAAMREAYSDRPGNQGLLFLSPAAATEAVRRADELGFNITTHGIGDAGIETILDAYEQNGVTAGDRWQIEHAQVTDLAMIDRFAALGVIGSMQTSFATTDQRFAESALGPDRLATSYNWRTMLDRGVRLVGSTDFPVEVLAPLWGVQRTVTRVEFDGFPDADGFQPGQRLDLATTLRLLTSDAAYASLEEDDRGTIEIGRWADLTVVREDLFTLPPDCIASATVLLTVVNGRVAFEGAQAFPPGAADCASGAAPNGGGAVITELAAGTPGPTPSDLGAAKDPSLVATGGGLATLSLLTLAGAFQLRRRN